MTQNQRSGVAGRILSESELRSYMRCSWQWKLGGHYDLNYREKIIRHTFEYWITQKVMNPRADQNLVLSKAVVSAMTKHAPKTLMHNQKQKLRNEALLWMDQFLREFNEFYLPQTGPQHFNAKLRSVAIKLRVSGTMRRKNTQTLHVFDFSPITHWRDLYSDPIVHAKVRMLGNVIANSGNRTQLMFHSLYIGEHDDKFTCRTIMKEELDSDYLNKIKPVFDQIGRGEAMPHLPCSIKCPYKKTRCKPGRTVNGKK